MQPVEFTQQNGILAKEQPQYLPLPVYRTKDGLTISCWRLSFKERLKLLFTGRMWVHMLTFNQPLQPLFLDVDDPFKELDRVD